MDKGRLMINEDEFGRIVDRCRDLPKPEGYYIENDYICNLFLTVLDFQMAGTTVSRAMSHYRENRWDEVRDFESLRQLLSEYPDDEQGNTVIAQFLWGYRYWNGVSLLRRLISFFQSIDVISQDALRHWSRTRDYEKDFKGKVPGMGYAIYKWLVMRQGVETVKPDVHVRRFVESVISRRLKDQELVAVLEEVAARLDLKAYELDWRIWEYQRQR